MPSPFSLGAQNADLAFDNFVDDEIQTGLVASATGDATVTGLGFTPDWVIAQLNVEGITVGWSATSTTLTFAKSGTTAASVSYICGNLT
jgi:hypothetical protein